MTHISHHQTILHLTYTVGRLQLSSYKNDERKNMTALFQNLILASFQKTFFQFFQVLSSFKRWQQLEFNACISCYQKLTAFSSLYFLQETEISQKQSVSAQSVSFYFKVLNMKMKRSTRPYSLHTLQIQSSKTYTTIIGSFFNFLFQIYLFKISGIFSFLLVVVISDLIFTIMLLETLSKQINQFWAGVKFPHSPILL